MNFIDMMRAGVTENDPFFCPIPALLRGLIFEGFARDVVVGLSAGGLLFMV
jgi:hypothetical protein